MGILGRHWGLLVIISEIATQASFLGLKALSRCPTSELPGSDDLQRENEMIKKTAKVLVTT